MRNIPPAAELVQPSVALHAQPGLQTARRVIYAGMDHLTAAA